MDGSVACGCGFELATSKMSGKLEVVQETNLDNLWGQKGKGRRSVCAEGEVFQNQNKQHVLFCICLANPLEIQFSLFD